MANRIVEMRGIRKTFSGVDALKDIDFDLDEGEVHALMGENGAGKSTLSKIIAGIHQASAGTMKIRGKEQSFASTKEAAKHGIAIVTQEFSLLPDFSIAENIFLSDERYYRHKFLSDQRAMVRETRKLLELFGMEAYLDPYENVKALSVAQMQVIEILKAVSKEADIIILDEPTASLSEKEIAQLFAIIRKLKEKKVSFIIVSHKINEIYEISDRITVLRDGRLILKGAETKELPQAELIKAMVGREVTDLYGTAKREKKDFSNEEIALKAEEIVDEKQFLQKVSFFVRRGEIVGFSGLIGAGRSELMRCIYGIDPIASGSVYLYGKELKRPGIRSSMRKGMGFVSEDRKHEGLIQDMSVLKNITLAKQAYETGMLIKHRADEQDCLSMVERLGIKLSSVDQAVKSLSGGNQQKVLFAKWLLLDPKLLIVDEPTRGVDIGAKADIYDVLRKLADSGVSIIMVSSEIPEIMGVCDRAYIMKEGRITGELSADEMDEETIGYFSTLG